MALMSQPVGNTGGNSYLYSVCIDDLYANREPRIYIEETPTLRSERNGLKVMTVGTVSPNSAMGGRVIGVNGLCFTICACTHSYGMGNVCDTRFINNDRIEI